MTEAGENLGIENFAGKSKINYEMFKKFMTKLIEYQ